MGKRIVISGSNGFVGRYVKSALGRDEKNNIVKELDITLGDDLCNPHCVENLPEFDCFIHLANLVYVPTSYQSPEKYYRINYLTTLNALEICRKRNAKFVYVSSYIYGPPQYLPVDEKHPICPFNPYSQTKVICEKLCEGYHRDFHVNISILRPFNILGVGQKGNLLIPEIIGQLKEGKKKIELKASHPRRDYINVEDVAEAIMFCVNDMNEYGVYNVCSGESFSVKEITELINKHLKNKVEFLFSTSDRPNEIDDTRGCCEKLKSIGWKQTKTIEEGIIDILKTENL